MMDKVLRVYQNNMIFVDKTQERVMGQCIFVIIVDSLFPAPQ